jgi:tetratricopeptide (TPR) repeat protein
MQVPPSRQPGKSSWPPPAFSLDAKIEDPELVVDGMLAALARGRLAEDAWDRLHAAARRDDRVEEIASAFVTVSRGARIKSAQPSVSAEFLFQAARYFDEVLDDDLGAAMHLERSLALAPGHPGSFTKMESILGKRERRDKLAAMYCAAAPHRPRGQQALMLRRAVELLAAGPDGSEEGDTEGPADERVIELWQRILRLESGDQEARSQLEALYVKAGRFRDAVLLNEQSLAREPAPDEYLKSILLERIVELYGDKLGEPERAIGHVEQLLATDPAHEGARRVAEKLLGVKGLAGRAAAALAAAFEAQGEWQHVARCLSIVLESAHGARRTQLLSRLGDLKAERLADDAGALEAYEQALALDATDVEIRRRYLEAATRLGRHGEVAKLLERVIATAGDPEIEASARAQLGEAILGLGDTRRAKSVLSEVLTSSRAPTEARLRAARTLRAIHEAAFDRKALCDVLDRLASLEPDEDKRREANEQLAAVATKVRDTPRAIEANERLLSTGARATALEALAGLYRGIGQKEKYARVLEAQARDAESPEKARPLMMKAAHVRAREIKDPASAIATYRSILERFGQQRDVLALLLPLFESEGRWADVAETLAQDVVLAPRGERAPIFARLGFVRWTHLKRTSGAVDACAEALALDDREPTARATLVSIIEAAGPADAAALRAKLGALYDTLGSKSSTRGP